MDSSTGSVRLRYMRFELSFIDFVDYLWEKQDSTTIASLERHFERWNTSSPFFCDINRS